MSEAEQGRVAVAESNAAVLRRTWELFLAEPVTSARVERGDLEPVFDAYDPDIVWDVTPMGLPDLSVMHGHAGVRAFLSSWFAEFSRVEFELHELEGANDQVMSKTTQRGYGSGSGVPVEMTFWMVFTFRDGFATRMTMYPREEEALADFGRG